MSLQFKLQPSRTMAVLLIFGHLLAAGAVLVLPLPDWAIIGVLFFLAVDLAWMVWSRAWLRTSDAWVAIVARGDEWILRRRDGGEVAVSLLKDALVTPWLTLLSLKHDPSGVRIRIMLLKDNLDRESFRQLRILLRWGMTQRG